MAVDTETVKRVARLARIAVTEGEAESFRTDLNAILGFVEQLNKVDVSGVEPLTSVLPMALQRRADVVDDGFIADKVVGNAPDRHDDFFVVPKVVE